MSVTPAAVCLNVDTLILTLPATREAVEEARSLPLARVRRLRVDPRTSNGSRITGGGDDAVAEEERKHVVQLIEMLSDGLVCVDLLKVSSRVWMEARWLIPALAGCTGLEKLTWPAGRISDPESARLLFEKLKHLKEVHVGSVCLDHLPTGLRELRISQAMVVAPPLLRLLSQCTRLKSLSLRIVDDLPEHRSRLISCLAALPRLMFVDLELDFLEVPERPAGRVPPAASPAAVGPALVLPALCTLTINASRHTCEDSSFMWLDDAFPEFTAPDLRTLDMQSLSAQPTDLDARFPQLRHIVVAGGAFSDEKTACTAAAPPVFPRVKLLNLFGGDLAVLQRVLERGDGSLANVFDLLLVHLKGCTTSITSLEDGAHPAPFLRAHLPALTGLTVFV